MPFNYNKLWIYLKENNITKEELRIKIGVSPNTLVKMGKNEPVSLTVIDKICNTLNLAPSDIFEYVLPECSYRVGDVFKSVDLLKSDEIQTEINKIKNMLSHIDITSEETLNSVCKELMDMRKNVIVAIQNHTIYYAILSEFLTQLGDGGYAETEESCLIISINEKWTEYIDFDTIESCSVGDFTKNNVHIIDTLSKNDIKEIKHRYKSYVLKQ